MSETKPKRRFCGRHGVEMTGVIDGHRYDEETGALLGVYVQYSCPKRTWLFDICEDRIYQKLPTPDEGKESK